MSNKQELSIILTADGTGLTGTVRAASGEVRKFGVEIDDVGKKSENAGKKMDESAKTAGMFGKAMGAAAAAAIVGFSALVKHQIDVADNTLKMSQRIGMSVESLSALGYAAKRNGADVNVLNSALYGLADNAARAAGGAKLPSAAFRALGIDVQDAHGKIKPMDALLVEVARKMSSYPAGAGKVALANQVMGESGKQLLLTLDELGSDGLQSVIDKAHEAGQLLSTETAQAAAEFNDNLDALKGTVTALANEAMAQLLPQLNAVAAMMKDTQINTAGAGNEVGALERIFNVGAKAALIIKNVLDGLGITIIAVGKSAWASGVLMAQMMTAPAAAAAAFSTDGIDGVKKVIAGIGESAGDMKQTWSEGWSAFKQGWSEAGADILAGANKLDAAMTRTATSTTEVAVAVTEATTPIVHYGESTASAADKTQRLTAEQKALASVMADAARGLAGLRALQSGLSDDVADMKAELGGASKAQIEFNKTQREAARLYAQAAAAMDPSALDAYVKAMETAREKLNLGDAEEAADDAEARLQAIFADLGVSPLEKMIDQLKTLREELAKVSDPMSEAFDPAKVEKLNAAIMRTKGGLVEGVANSAAVALTAIQGMTDQGSREYEAMGLAIQVANIAAGIGAIVNQGMGDPYTAIPRMIAMAAMVSQLVDGIGSFAGGGFSDTAARRQETQGTGSVLGDAEAKSESIQNAVEITANATSELVGINRGMLRALQALQAGIGSAATMLARGAGDADFSDMNLAVGQNSLNSFFDGAGILGGKSKITDQGIVIFGGALNELLENIAVGAYQEVQSRSWAFGSTHTREGIKDVSDEFGAQFGLIISSIVDTVREGAKAIGLLPADIEARLEAYKVEEMRISLKGLSAEEQAAEIKAVLGKMFDGLAGHVVSFLPQFQKVGEGLGETLIRVATGVQVTQEAVKQLGFSLDETAPEKFAQISEALIELSGGIENFISGMTGFMNAFAPESHKLSVATEALNSAFEQSGLTVPKTAEGMWDLMRSLDATTEEGREQIATLIRLSGTAKEYYDLLAKAEKNRLDYIAKVMELETELGNGSQFATGKAEIDRWRTTTIDTLNTLARGAGRLGAAERDLILVREVAAQRLAQLIARMEDEARDLAAQLGYRAGADTIESLNSSIERLQGAAGSSAEAIGDAVSSMRQQIALLLGDLSPLNDRQKLEIARQGLQDGTASQEDFLQIARRLFGGTSRFRQEFEFAQRFPGGQTGGTNTDSAGGESNDTRSLSELIAARDELMTAQRGQMAHEMAGRVAELSFASEKSFEEVAKTLGFDLARLGADLGLDNEQLTAYLQTLHDDFKLADFNAVGDMIADAIDRSRIDIVRALGGTPSDYADMPAERFGGSLPRTGGTRDAGMDPPPPAPRAPAAEDADSSGTPAQRETNRRLASIEATVSSFLARIESNTGATADHTEAVAVETAEAAEQTRQLRRTLGEGGNNGGSRSDRGLSLPFQTRGR